MSTDVQAEEHVESTQEHNRSLQLSVCGCDIADVQRLIADYKEEIALLHTKHGPALLLEVESPSKTFIYTSEQRGKLAFILREIRKPDSPAPRPIIASYYCDRNPEKAQELVFLQKGIHQSIQYFLNTAK